MATDNKTVVITATRELETIHRLGDDNFVIPIDYAQRPELGEIALIHWLDISVNIRRISIGRYDGSFSNTGSIWFFVYTEITGQILSIERTNNLVYIRVEQLRITKVVKSKRALLEPTYYKVNVDITPIDTDVTFNKVAPPTNPVEPARVNKKLLRSYTCLFDQVQDASDIYQIVKVSTQCCPNTALEQAVKRNNLLRKTLR